MIKTILMELIILGLSSVILIGSTVSTLPGQLLYSSSGEETNDGDQQGGSTGTADEEPVDELEPETPSEDLPTSDEQEETTSAQQPVDPAPEREVCITKAKGQKFCYKELKPDEVCMKPINAEDPPICPPPEPEGFVNGTSGDTGNPSDVEMATADSTSDTVSEGIAINEKGKPADCLVKKTKC